jgi:hypothetical protein
MERTVEDLGGGNSSEEIFGSRMNIFYMCGGKKLLFYIREILVRGTASVISNAPKHHSNGGFLPLCSLANGFNALA